jgi:hypothetical protein
MILLGLTLFLCFAASLLTAALINESSQDYQSTSYSENNVREAQLPPGKDKNYNT